MYKLYQDFKEKGRVTAGLDVGLCLAFDIDVMNSLLEPTQGVEPWVWVVDESFDFETLDGIPEGAYSGHFPVTIDVRLVADAYRSEMDS